MRSTARTFVRCNADPECFELLPSPVLSGKKAVKVILTTAHLDQTPENCDDSNLAAMCQRCHLGLDRYQHAHNARQTRRAHKADRDLFPEQGGD